MTVGLINLYLTQYLTHKYFKELDYSMKGQCDGCGTENFELQQKDVQGQNKNLCANCANQ
jgi:hypothetical protein